MPRVIKKVARKEYVCSLTGNVITKGQEYWEFTPYRQKTRKCSRPPRPSEMTSSDKLSRVYSISEAINDFSLDNYDDPETIIEHVQSVLDEWSEEIESIADEYDESVDNMPESLQNSSKADEIREKAENLRTFSTDISGAIEGIGFEEYDEDSHGEDEELHKESELERIIGEIQDALSSLSVDL
jgi:hypothetical protein